MPNEDRREYHREFKRRQRVEAKLDPVKYAAFLTAQNERKRKYRATHPEKRLQWSRASNVKEKLKKGAIRALVGYKDRRKYKTEDERVSALRASWTDYRRRNQNNPHYKIATGIRSYIHARLGPKRIKETSRFRELTGCSVEALLKHIEAHWLPGMSWANYGFGVDKWTLDHTRPLAAFDLTDEDEQRAAFHWTNLKPMWHLDNIRKGAKVVMMPRGDWVPRGLKQGLLPV